MTTDEMIGNVVASYLRDHISSEDGSGVARYLLDCLTADQTAAIAKTILADTSLSKLVEIKERGQDVEKRRFSLGQDGKTMQVEIIPLSSDAKSTTRTYQKQDSQVAKNTL